MGLEKLLSFLLLAQDVRPIPKKTLAFLPEKENLGVDFAGFQSETSSICISASGDHLSIHPSPFLASDCIASGTFKETISQSGWNQLSITSDGTTRGAYAAGLAEGLLTGNVIKAHVDNLKKVYEDSDIVGLYKLFKAEDEDVKEVIGKKGKDEDEEKYLDVLRSSRTQLEGILDATIHLGMSLTIEDLYFINTDGDIQNLELQLPTVPITSPLFLQRHQYPRCSALIKITEDDVFFAHSTQEEYGAMNRMLKTYTFADVKVALSSYPGAIASTDDFILTSHGLAVMETSLTFTGEELVENKGAIPGFYRAIAAARISRKPQEFVDTFLQHNSNSYFSQWMIFDYNKANNLSKNAFFVLETSPGFATFRDMTEELIERSYWASYNFPYFPETVSHSIFASESAIAVRKAQFAVLQADIESMSDMKRVMQYNGWRPEDCDSDNPLTPCIPDASIAPRFDLRFSGVWFGATDAKVTSRSGMQDLSFSAISGPPHQDLPVFSFPRDSPFSYIPAQWSFDWVLYP